MTPVSGHDIINGHDTDSHTRAPELPERLDRQKRLDRPERVEQPERAERPQRTERPPQGTGRPERTERVPRAEGERPASPTNGGPGGRRPAVARTAPTAPIGPGLAGVPLSLEPLNRKDFTSDQEVRWCPGCGDYAVLAAFQGFMPELGIRKENTVIISGIGCSSRFPYYVDSFGMHSIHGRATAIATGVATAREDAAVFVITGDGDALSIGGNHLIHVLRRNVNLTILLFNNRIYGLTKGQYSPTSEIGKITKSTPLGSLDNPFNPVSLALGAEATFVARTVDSDRKHLTEVLTAAAAHRGASFVEIYQNCPIFNDDAFLSVKNAETSPEAIIPLRHGEPIRFGADESKGVIRDPVSGAFQIVEVDDVGADRLVVHDAHASDPTYAFGLSRLTDTGVLHRAPIGIFRDVQAPAYDDLAREQVRLAEGDGTDDAALQAMIAGPDTWTVVG